MAVEIARSQSGGIKIPVSLRPAVPADNGQSRRRIGMVAGMTRINHHRGDHSPARTLTWINALEDKISRLGMLEYQVTPLRQTIRGQLLSLSFFLRLDANICL